MTRTFYDAIHPANIPTNAQGVAGYVDGRYAWSATDWARFPHSVKARIAVFSATNDGHVLDVEPGCSTPANAPGWVVRRRAAGVDPTVYCSLSQWPVVRAAFVAAKVAQPHWWVAAYPGNGPNLYPGSIAHQYANPGPVDISVVADYWPGVDPKPVPTLTPTPEVNMTITQADAEHIAAEVWRYDQAGTKPQAWGFLQKAAVPPAPPIDVNALAAAIVAAGGVGVTAAAIAKAVNDDAARRLVA